ncbi:hypothetical protein QUB30_00835 [Microcoleus sp. BROC3]
MPPSPCFTQLAIDQVVSQILARGKKVGCNVTRRYPLRPMRVFIYQDFSHSESQNCTSGSREMSV